MLRCKTPTAEFQACRIRMAQLMNFLLIRRRFVKVSEKVKKNARTTRFQDLKPLSRLTFPSCWAELVMHRTFTLWAAGYLALSLSVPGPALAQRGFGPTPPSSPAGPPASMVDIAYVEPTNPGLWPLYERLRKRQV